jgi:hypothetical protein
MPDAVKSVQVHAVMAAEIPDRALPKEQYDTGARFSDARPGQRADGGGANKASRGIV